MLAVGVGSLSYVKCHSQSFTDFSKIDTKRDSSPTQLPESVQSRNVDTLSFGSSLPMSAFLSMLQMVGWFGR